MILKSWLNALVFSSCFEALATLRVLWSPAPTNTPKAMDSESFAERSVNQWTPRKSLVHTRSHQQTSGSFKKKCQTRSFSKKDQRAGWAPGFFFIPKDPFDIDSRECGALPPAACDGGIFYGGEVLQPSHSQLRDFMMKRFGKLRADQVAWVDVHTGLGPTGRSFVFFWVVYSRGLVYSSLFWAFFVVFWVGLFGG